jgi:predicted aspartyl protease
MQRNSHIRLYAGRECSRAGAYFCCFGPARCVLVLMALLGVVPASFADVPGPAVVPFHFVRGFAVVVPVTVNGSGPYDFMLDTGSTVTAVDRELARALALDVQERGTVTTLVERVPVSLAVACRISVGPITERSVEIMIRDLGGLRRIDPAIRGVLGQNALDHANFLLDYRHKLLEFDTDGELERSLAGRHVPLRREVLKDNPRYGNLAVQASISTDGIRMMDFLLDSGSASLVLFGGVLGNMGGGQNLVGDVAGREQMAELHHAQLLIDGKSREVATQTVAFQAAGPRIGGLLPTGLFSRIYISNRGGFAMFEPKQKKPGPLDRMIASLPPQAPGGSR